MNGIELTKFRKRFLAAMRKLDCLSDDMREAGMDPWIYVGSGTPYLMDGGHPSCTVGIGEGPDQQAVVAEYHNGPEGMGWDGGDW